MKYEQHIVAIPAAFFDNRKDGVLKVNSTNIGHEVTIKRRSTLHNDFNYRKLNPIVVFVRDGKIKAFKRKMDHVHEALRGTITVGIGGHFEVEDVVFENSVIEFKKSLVKVLLREMQEEVSRVGDYEAKNIEVLDFFIAADETITDRQYATIVSVVEVISGDVLPNEVEDELDDYGWFTPQELLSIGEETGNSETWTTKVCEILLGKHD